MTQFYRGQTQKWVAGQTVDVGYQFIVPKNTQSNGLISVELRDAQNICYSKEYGTEVQRSRLNDTYDHLQVSGVLSIPAVLPPLSHPGDRFVLFWTYATDNNILTGSDYVDIEPPVDIHQGPQHASVIYGDVLSLNLVTPFDTPPDVQITYEHGYLPITSVTTTPVHSGFLHTAVLETTGTVPPMLDPYQIIWRQEGQVFTSRAFVVSNSVLRAASELDSYLNRLRRKMRLDALNFDLHDLLLYLKAGRDRFNTIGVYTEYTMLNAQGMFHYWWNICSQTIALRVKYLEEGESSFDFSGQNITLTIDITQYIESLLSKLEEDLQSNLIPFKKQLIARGRVSGDGSSTGFTALNVGAAGLTANPAGTVFRRFYQFSNVRRT